MNKIDKNSVILENLNILSDRVRTTKALANFLIKDFISFELMPYIQHRNSGSSIISKISPIVQNFSCDFETEYKVYICKNIRDICLNTNVDLWTLICRSDNSILNYNIAYVDNRFSTKAYSIFESHLKNSKGYVYQSFNEMCDSVEAGLCNCCIVPIENTIDGKLLTFYSLMDRFDIKISMVCDIEAEDGSERTRYALLKYHLSKPNSIDNKIYYEFNHTSSNEIEIAKIIEAAVLCGLTVSRVDSLPLIHNDSNFIMHTVVCGNKNDILNYLVYLSIYVPQFNTIALYSLVK